MVILRWKASGYCVRKSAIRQHGLRLLPEDSTATQFIWLVLFVGWMSNGFSCFIVPAARIHQGRIAASILHFVYLVVQLRAFPKPRSCVRHPHIPLAGAQVQVVWIRSFENLPSQSFGACLSRPLNSPRKRGPPTQCLPLIIARASHFEACSNRPTEAGKTIPKAKLQVTSQNAAHETCTFPKS